jgi:hypothetical protein
MSKARRLRMESLISRLVTIGLDEAGEPRQRTLGDIGPDEARIALDWQVVLVKRLGEEARSAAEFAKSRQTEADAASVPQQTIDSAIEMLTAMKDEYARLVALADVLQAAAAPWERDPALNLRQAIRRYWRR